MHHTQMTSNAAQIHAIHIQADSLLAHAIWLVLCLRIGRVTTMAVLATHFGASDSDLASGLLTLRTWFHPLTLTYTFSFSHSQQLDWLSGRSAVG